MDGKYLEDINTIIGRYVKYGHAAMTAANGCDLDALVASINGDGSWSDIDYESNLRSNWKCCRHIRNTLNLAYAWYFNKNDDYLQAALKSLDYWRRLNPVNPNWWWNVIGVPMILCRVALALDSVLEGDRRTWLAEAINVEEPQYAKTGQNFVWMAEVRFCRGLFLRDEELIKGALNDILSVVVVVDEGEGICRDWSFHQHGKQMQFGNYGLSFICDHSRLLCHLNGTVFDYPSEKKAIIASLASEGYSWISWKGMLDVSCLGRQIFPNAQRNKCKSIETAVEDLKTLGYELPPRKGFRAFPYSAYAIYRTENWMATVRASTATIIGVETHVNEDNTKGMCMADGALFTYVTGREYENVFPLWDDWRMVPGVTAYAGKPLERKRQMNETEDVEAFETEDGGVFSFTFKREGLTARKKWTFRENGVLCEGSGITAEDDGYEVMTSIEESLACDNAAVVYEKPDEICIRNGNIEYIVYAPRETVHFEVADRSGSFSEFMQALDEEIVSGKVFSLRISHGYAPKNANYRYEIRPIV